MSIHLDRAMFLLEQSRYELAEQELRQELAGDPDNPAAHAILAICLSKREQHEPATEAARQAIALGPDIPFTHYSLARVYMERNRLDEAQSAIGEAIRLDPEDADFCAILAAIQFDRHRWSDALSSAERGLTIDAEHVGCTNLRAMALVKLGRRAEAGATIDAALARDPENAVTHANQGWTYLHQAKHDRALEHFREALRLDAELDWARAGMVEALKARYFIYGWMLRYFLWMGRLSGRAQWLVVFGGFFAYQVARNLAAGNPALRPWVQPFLVAYIAFALMSWIASPLFNLLLRLNRFGRYALAPPQIVEANWIGVVLVLAVASLVAWFATGSDSYMIAAAACAAMSVPLVGAFRTPEGWPRRAMMVYAAGLALVGAIMMIFIFADFDIRLGGFSVGVTTVQVFFIGSVLSGFAANALMPISVRK